MERTLDTVVWQLLASVICPGYTIHTVVALVHAGLLPVEVRSANASKLWLRLRAGCLGARNLQQETRDGPDGVRMLDLQQLEPIREGVNALAAAVSLQGDLLMTLIDKSLPTACGLAGEHLSVYCSLGLFAGWCG